MHTPNVVIHIAWQLFPIYLISDSVYYKRHIQNVFVKKVIPSGTYLRRLFKWPFITSCGSKFQIALYAKLIRRKLGVCTWRWRHFLRYGHVLETRAGKLRISISVCENGCLPIDTVRNNVSIYLVPEHLHNHIGILMSTNLKLAISQTLTLLTNPYCTHLFHIHNYISFKYSFQIVLRKIFGQWTNFERSVSVPLQSVANGQSWWMPLRPMKRK